MRPAKRAPAALVLLIGLACLAALSACAPEFPATPSAEECTRMVNDSNKVLEDEVLAVFTPDDLRSVTFWAPEDAFWCDPDEGMDDYGMLSAMWADQTTDSAAPELLRSHGWTELEPVPPSRQGRLAGALIFESDDRTITVAVGRYGFDAGIGDRRQLAHKVSMS